MNDIEAALTAHVRELASKFIVRTRGEVEAFEGLHARLRGRDPEAIEALTRWAHRIHGTAATLGLDDLSEHGGEIERLLMGASRNKFPLDEAACEAVLKHYDQLTQALEAAPRWIDLPVYRGAQPDAAAKNAADSASAVVSVGGK